MLTAAILPVKRFAQAKQRLGASIADSLRLDLARAMVSDVLDALSATSSIELTIVVTDEPSVADTARAQGAIAIEDSAQDGQSAAVALGIERALREGMERALCIPGDCPTLDPNELEELLGAPARDTAEVVIVPDRHGTGTNGLLLAPPGVIAPSFGPDSRERHSALAVAAGVPWRIERPASLLLDIDTGEDLAVLRGRLTGDQPIGEHHARARRTRAVLDQAVRQDRPVFTAPV
jgi:2-phospho-L-lactate/phosphoenolpyruvate guanylyltransferase